MVQAQAMACGLPIITTKNTGGGELVENNKNGFVIPIRDIQAIKEKILYLYKNKESSKRMGQKAIETVHNGFSWSDYGDRYAENLKEIGDDAGVHHLVQMVTSTVDYQFE